MVLDEVQSSKDPKRDLDSIFETYQKKPKSEMQAKPQTLAASIVVTSTVHRKLGPLNSKDPKLLQDVLNKLQSNLGVE